jgi:hypothetical protein
MVVIEKEVGNANVMDIIPLRYPRGELLCRSVVQ